MPSTRLVHPPMYSASKANANEAVCSYSPSTPTLQAHRPPPNGSHRAKLREIDILKAGLAAKALRPAKHRKKKKEQRRWTENGNVPTHMRSVKQRVKKKKGEICTPLFVGDFGAASPIYTIKYATLLTSIT